MDQSDTSKVDQRLIIIGDHVRKLRKEKAKLPYIEFAKKVGLNKNTVFKVERGKEEYYTSSLLKIISYYPDVSMESFFRDIGL